MGLECVHGLLSQQHGVVARRQLLEAGLVDHDIARLVRHKELTRVHTGVYVNHTGSLSWVQRAWAALLTYWPAALCDESALIAFGVRSAARRADPTGPVPVAVGEKRRVKRTEGVRVRRMMGAPSQFLRTPARSAAPHLHASLEALAAHPNLHRRGFLAEVLEDVASGAYSLLEHRYLTRVERPHGLPTATRQRKVRPGRTSAYRDVEYLLVSAVVELDGRLGHEETLDRWDDLDRDIESILAGDTTMRLGWRHVLDSYADGRSFGGSHARGEENAPEPPGTGRPEPPEGDLPEAV